VTLESDEIWTSESRSTDPLLSMLEDTRVPTLVVDGGSRSTPIEYANGAFRGVAGYSTGELVGHPLGLLAGRLTDRRAVAALRRRARSGRSAYSRIIAYRKDESPFQADWRVEWEGSSLSKKQRYYCSLRNIRDVSPAVPQVENPPVELVRTAVIIATREGWIIRASCSAGSLLRLGSEPLVGQHVRFLDTHIGIRAGGRSIACIVQAGETWDGVIRNGSGRGLFVSIDPMSSGGMVIVIRDDSEGRRIEALAESVNLMNHTGYVFAGVRHELGNPINNLKTGLSVMRSQDANFDATKRRTYYDNMLAEIGRVEYLLKGLRAFNAHEDINVRRIIFSELIDALWRVVLPDARSKGLDLIRRIDDGLVILSDDRALYQALLNVVMNAMEAVELVPDGRIELFAGVVEECVLIQVSDNGPGMTTYELERAQHPFFTTKPAGTGLGLPITCRILARIGGHLELDSQVGFGTTARIILPRVPA
jgi:signal transduction histidine kinase